jgi:polyphenol oxidase
MASTYDDSRREFLRRMAQLGAVAGVAGFGAMPLPAFAAEPQNCAGPKPPQTPIKWTPDTNPVLPRLPASTLSSADADRLRNGYKALRALAQSDPNDPRGWLQQGDKHCWNCGGGLDGQAGEEIHGSWLFLPWHRAFLYFHERILGTLINDKSLRLAYWDWDNAAHRAVPSAWLTPNNATNPLFDANRSAVAGNQLPSFIVGPSVMNPIRNATTFTQFGGNVSNPGILENGPHGGVHVWCGDTTLQSGKADMGLLDTAAQDPLFFAHHANIDRLWDQWMKSSPSHKNPTSLSWLRHKFTFWDEQKRWVSITVADVINMSTNLRYTYGTGTGTTPQPSPQITAIAATPKVLKLPSDPEKGVTVPEEVRKRLLATKAGPSTTPPAGPAGEGAGEKLTTLRVEGITLPPDAAGIFRIVANGADQGLPEEGSPNDLGYVAIVPKTSKGGGHAHGGQPLTVELDVTQKLPRLIEKEGTLKLAYVPMAQGASAKSNRLPFSGVYLIER